MKQGCSEELCSKLEVAVAEVVVTRVCGGNIKWISQDGDANHRSSPKNTELKRS